MTIGKTRHPYAEEVVPEGKRLRMKDWLTSRIGNPRYPGLVWLDDTKQSFRIPWKHAALHGWNQDSDGALFRDWAEHTGACVQNSHPKQLKATFRCALHSLPDVHEDKNQAKKKGDNACRVYDIDSTTPPKSLRRHIRIRGHKERERSRKISRGMNRLMPYDEMTSLQRSIEAQQPSSATPYSNWSGETFLARTHNQNDDGFRNSINNNNNFQLHERLQNNMSMASNESTMQRAWITKSIQDISTHEMLPLPINDSCIYQNNFATSQQSLSVPNSSNSYFTQTQNLYESTSPQQNLSPLQGYEYYPAKCEVYEQDLLPFNSHTLSPVSPGSMSYTPSYSSMTPSPVQSLSATTFSVGSPTHGPDTSAQVFANASAVIEDFHLPNSLEFSSNNSVFGEEKFLTSMDALIASGAVQQTPESTPCISEAMNTPLPSTLPTMQSQSNSTRNLSFEECHHQPSASDLLMTGNHGEIRESVTIIHQQTRRINAILDNVSPNNDYIDTCTPVSQYATENHGNKSPTSGWISSSQHESMLPSASTLLSPNSPTTKGASLQWIPSANDETSILHSPASNLYNSIHYEPLPVSSSNYYTNVSMSNYSERPSITISLPMYNRQTSPVYGGYCSQ